MQRLLDSWHRVPPRTLLPRLQSQRDEAAVPIEALVAVARALVRDDMAEDAWRVVEMIAERTAAKTYRHLATWGVTDLRHREDATQEILRMLIERVYSIAPQDEFWECRFWVCFDRRVRTLLRDFRREGAEEVPWDDQAADGVPENVGLAASSYGDAAQWTDNVVARDALARLPEPLRTAFYLKYYYGYRDEGSGSEPSIGQMLQVSGRTVRNYLRRAEQILAEWRMEATL